MYDEASINLTITDETVINVKTLNYSVFISAIWGDLGGLAYHSPLKTYHYYYYVINTFHIIPCALLIVMVKQTLTGDQKLFDLKLVVR